MDISISKVELAISIIVPVYNVEKYLNRCLDSILNQIFTDFELILVDDGSTDNSGIICDEYKTKDNRIKVIHKENGGLSSARNAGLDIARGRYIGFVDSDDFISKDMYQILYNEAEKNKADMIMCEFKKVDKNYEAINNNLYKKSDIKLLKKDEILEDMYSDMYDIYVVSWNKLYDKELFLNLRFPLGKVNEDEFLAHELIYRSKKIIFANKILYYYVQRVNSIMSSSFNEKRLDILDAYINRINFSKRVGCRKLRIQTEYYFINRFFRYFFIAKYQFKFSDKKMRKLKKLFVCNLPYFLCNPNYIYKEKILWIIFIVSSGLYEKINNKFYTQICRRI